MGTSAASKDPCDRSINALHRVSHSQASRAADSSRRIHGRIPNRLLSYLTPPDSSSGVWSVKSSPHGPRQSSPNRAYPCQTVPLVPAGHESCGIGARHCSSTIVARNRDGSFQISSNRPVESPCFSSPRTSIRSAMLRNRFVRGVGFTFIYRPGLKWPPAAPANKIGRLE